MTWPYALLVGTAAAASMMTYWITIRVILPWIRLRQAAAVSLGFNAVASTHWYRDGEQVGSLAACAGRGEQAGGPAPFP